MATAMVQVNVRITPELHERLMAEVAKQQTTATAVVTAALTKHLWNGGKAA
jgi:predicted HicB family RNase H-like nuclease